MKIDIDFVAGVFFDTFCVCVLTYFQFFKIALNQVSVEINEKTLYLICK
jgi:hypothetical protein